MVKDVLSLIQVIKENPNCHIHWYDNDPTAFTVYKDLEAFQSMRDFEYDEDNEEDYEKFVESITLWDGDVGSSNGYVPEIVEVLLSAFGSKITTSSE